MFGQADALAGLAGPGITAASLAGLVPSQRARLITVATPLSGALVAERFQGEEGVSEPYFFDIDCLSGDAALDLSSCIGGPLTLRLLLADGLSTRLWHGLVTEAAQLGADGGLARYRLRMQPWLALLAHRRTSRIFQDKTVEEIVSEVFAHYPAARFRFRLNTALRPRSLCVQYRETDLAFVTRLLASEGLSYVFEHDQDTENDADAEAHTQHGMLIFDAQEPVPECAQAAIRFHRASATEASDSIQVWRPRQTVTANVVSLTSWDYKKLTATGAQAELHTGAPGGLGTVPALEIYQGQEAYRHASTTDAERAARVAAGYLALSAQSQYAEGTVRVLAPFTQFELLEHSAITPELSHFTVLKVWHEAANNLSAGIARHETDSTLENGTYRNRADCVSATLPLVPHPQPKPRMPGLQSAIVVGRSDVTADTGTHSDRDHRVKVQFPWQRGSRPIAEALAHDAERATGDDTNGTWLRVAGMLAGPNWGSAFAPRVGSEVLVDFIDGDPDRPLVVAQLYNGAHTPPWPAGEESGANHAGAVSGIHAPTLDGQSWSQWQVDDTTGEGRTRIATSLAATQVELGHLISHAPTGGQRGAYRGSGFELRTAGWAVARAPQGLLLSGTARPRAVTTQLDVTEAAGLVKGAAQLTEHLQEAARQSKCALTPHADRIEAFARLTQPEPPPSDGRDAPDRPLRPFSGPALQIEAPTTIALTTPHSSTLFAGEHLLATVQQDAHFAAQHTAAFVAGEGADLYTHAGGVTAIAANGLLSLHAHDGPLEILADQSVTLTSSTDEVHILAKSKIVLQAGQSSVTLDGGNITFACPGSFTVKGASKVLAGAGSVPASYAALPSQSARAYQKRFRLIDKATGVPVVGCPYFIRLDGGTVIHGVSDAEGNTDLAQSNLPEKAALSVWAEAMKKIAEIK